MNLNEEISRMKQIMSVICEDYSPAGKEIPKNELSPIVIHKSDPKNQDSIKNNGLIPKTGECYKTYAGYGVKCTPAIFATNTTNSKAFFDQDVDGDIWEIDTTEIPDVKWYKDRHYDSSKKHIVTFQPIPPKALKLQDKEDKFKK